MARLTESELAGFRIGAGPPTAQPSRNQAPAGSADQDADVEQPALMLDPEMPVTRRSLGPVPPAPARTDARHKIGLTLPLELAEQIRDLTYSGYALSDLVMVAYARHRDELVHERDMRTPRQLQRRSVGRSSFTITLSGVERDALDSLARHLDRTRSHTVAALLERHVLSRQPDAAATAESPEQRSPA